MFHSPYVVFSFHSNLFHLIFTLLDSYYGFFFSAILKSYWQVKLYRKYSVMVVYMHMMRNDYHSQLTYPSPLMCSVTKLCPTLCDPLDGSPPGFSVHGILQTRTLEWVGISFSRESSRPRGQTHTSCTGRCVLWSHLGSLCPHIATLLLLVVWWWEYLRSILLANFKYTMIINTVTYCTSGHQSFSFYNWNFVSFNRHQTSPYSPHT